MSFHLLPVVNYSVFGCAAHAETLPAVAVVTLNARDLLCVDASAAAKVAAQLEAILIDFSANGVFGLLVFEKNLWSPIYTLDVCPDFACFSPNNCACLVRAQEAKNA